MLLSIVSNDCMMHIFIGCFHLPSSKASTVSLPASTGAGAWQRKDKYRGGLERGYKVGQWWAGGRAVAATTVAAAITATAAVTAVAAAIAAAMAAAAVEAVASETAEAVVIDVALISYCIFCVLFYIYFMFCSRFCSELCSRGDVP